MDNFANALLSGKTEKIPDEFDWFASLVGDWDFDYYDGETSNRRHVKGEWFFRRILEGSGIEDIFICPSRETAKTDPQPDGEYGVAMRMFNENKKFYDMVYITSENMKRLTFKKEGEKLVGTLCNNENEKWIFSEISETTFHWQNVTVLSNSIKKVNADIFAKRKSR